MIETNQPGREKGKKRAKSPPTPFGAADREVLGEREGGGGKSFGAEGRGRGREAPASHLSAIRVGKGTLVKLEKKKPGVTGGGGSRLVEHRTIGNLSAQGIRTRRKKGGNKNLSLEQTSPDNKSPPTGKGKKRLN